MSLDPLLNAPLVIQFHAFAAMAAVLLGSVQLWRPKGTPSHKVIGWIWALLMMAIALSSFQIHEIRQIGQFSIIHGLSILTLITVPMAVVAARRGRIDMHSKSMKSIFIYALIVAGIFTLLPGRILGRVISGG